MPIDQAHCHCPGECRFLRPCSPRPPVGPADPNGLLMLTSHAELCRGEQAVDDVVILPHAIINELTIAFGPDAKQRRPFSFRNSPEPLHVDLLTLIELGDGAPGGIVALY